MKKGKTFPKEQIPGNLFCQNHWNLMLGHFSLYVGRALCCQQHKGKTKLAFVAF